MCAVASLPLNLAVLGYRQHRVWYFIGLMQGAPSCLHAHPDLYCAIVLAKSSVG